MARFQTSTKDNSCNQIFVQGARSHNNSNDIAAVIFQNYDDDTKLTYNMASIAMLDEFGNTECNGSGCLIIKTNIDGSNLTEKMRIDNVGNLLIGTSNPRARLTIAGGISADTAAFTSNLMLILTSAQSNAAVSSNIVIFADQSDGKLKALKPNSNIVSLESPIQFTSSNLFASDSNLSLSTSSNFINKLVLTTSQLPTGTYRADTYFEIFNNTSNTSTIKVRSWINDSNNGIWSDGLLLCPSFENKSIVTPHHDFTVFAHTNSNIVVGLDFASPSGTEVGIQMAKISVFQMNVLG